MNLTELLGLEPTDFYEHDLNTDEFRHILETCDALWLHSGDLKAPHAELTSGDCSTGFVDTLRALTYPNLCEIMALQLVNKIPDMYNEPIDWVVGSDHASATLSFAVASLFNARHDFTEKGPNKTQIWKRFTIEPGEIVLQVEELVTTTHTMEAVRDGIRKGNSHPVEFAPFVLTLVHRADVYKFENTPIIYVAHFDIQTWKQSECPLCAQGSERVRPKSKENWARLTGKT